LLHPVSKPHNAVIVAPCFETT